MRATYANRDQILSIALRETCLTRARAFLEGSEVFAEHPGPPSPKTM